MRRRRRAGRPPARCPTTGSGCSTGSGRRRRRPRRAGAPRRRRASRSGRATPGRSSQPVRSRYSVGRQPNVASENASSSAFSAKWVCRRTSRRSASSAERTISCSVTLNGEHGASATRVIAPWRAVVVAADGLLAGGEDVVVVGHDVVGRQAAVLLRQRHRAARRVEAHAEVARRRRSRRRAGRRRRAGGGRGGRSRSCTRTGPARRGRPTPTGTPPRCRGAAHSGYSDCNQPNSGLSVIGGYARVRFWNRWWWVLTRPGVTRQPAGVDRRASPAAAAPVPTALTSPSVMATQPPAELARGRRPSSPRSGRRLTTRSATAAGRRRGWRRSRRGRRPSSAG